MQAVTQVAASGSRILVGCSVVKSVCSRQRGCQSLPIKRQHSRFSFLAAASDVSASYLGSGLRGVCAFGQSRKPARIVMGVAEQVAKGYAQALMELAQSKGALEAVHDDIGKLKALVSDSQDVLDFLCNPIADPAKKQKLIASLGQNGFNKYTVNFLNLLVEKKRIDTLGFVVEAFEDMYNDITQTQDATVVSAIKLGNSQQALIAKKLQALTGAKNIKLKNEVDPELIAGFKLKYGKGQSEQIDFSVQGQLEQLRLEFESGFGMATEAAEEKVAA